MNLSGRIMAMHNYNGDNLAAWDGFENARLRAARLATEADDLMIEMAACLSELIEVAEGSSDYADRVCAKVPKMALARYNAYKEQ